MFIYYIKYSLEVFEISNVLHFFSNLELKIQPATAGATFMAISTSAPELFVRIGLFCYL